MVVTTVLTPGTEIQSPDGIIMVVGYEGGMYDLESNGQNCLMDANAVDYLIGHRVWEVQPCA